jgi:putative FmdB family regulatory protein
MHLAGARRASIYTRCKMPIYEFSCPSCGVFEQMRPVMEAGTPMDCPECGAPARRRFGVPRGRSTPPAHERNERSANEPVGISRRELDTIEATSPRDRHHNEPQRPWQIGH